MNNAFLLLIFDKVYSRIISIINFLIFPLLILSIYLYSKLPSNIPTHVFLDSAFDNWWRKEIIFVFPGLFLFWGYIFSEKRITNQFSEGIPLLFVKILASILGIILFTATVFAFNFYFNML